MLKRSKVEERCSAFGLTAHKSKCLFEGLAKGFSSGRCGASTHLGHDKGKEMDSDSMFGFPVVLDRIRTVSRIQHPTDDNGVQGMPHRVGAKLAREECTYLESSRHIPGRYPCSCLLAMHCWTVSRIQDMTMVFRACITA